MDSDTLAGFKMVLPGKVPFANAAQASESGSPGIITPDAESGQFSMPDGFGVNFDAAPTATGAEMVQRGQINYIGKMASYAQFMGQCGKGYWGFDPEVCTAIDGYPEGAILTLVEGGCYLKIVSLHDNNTVDFTGRTNTTDYPKITNGTVDGVNWQYLSLDPKTLLDQSVVATVPNLSAPRQIEGVIGCFQAKTDGAVIAKGNINFTDLTESGEMNPGFLSVILSEGRPNLSGSYSAKAGLDGWEPYLISDNTTEVVQGKEIFVNGNTITTSVQLATVEKGKWYAIGYVARWCQVTESTLTFHVVN